MFSAPKLLIILGLAFLLIILPAMAGISLIAIRRTSKKVAQRSGRRVEKPNPEAFLR